MRSHIDPYAELNVSRSATIAEIKAAYHRRAFELHPDTADPALYAEGVRGVTEKTFQNLTSAYKTLTNPVLRAAYDASVSEPVQIPFTVADQVPPPTPPAQHPSITLLQIPCSVFIQGGELVISLDDGSPLAVQVPAGAPAGHEISSVIGPLILLPVSTPHEWIVERDFYIRIPVTIEQIKSGELIQPKYYRPIPPIRINPDFPLNEWIFSGMGLPKFEGHESGDLHVLLASQHV